MKILFISLGLLLSISTLASGYDSSEFCSSAGNIARQEFQRLSYADNDDGAIKWVGVLRVRLALMTVCDDTILTDVVSENYCQDIKKLMSEEFQVVSSAANIDDEQAARTSFAIFDAGNEISAICD